MSSKIANKHTPKPILSAADLMPKNKQAMRILRERADYLSIPEADKKEQEGFTPFIKFRLGTNECYGIPYRFVKEVVQHLTPTKLPLVPQYIAGVINHRGALLPIFDLKQIFHMPPYPNEHVCLILVNAANLTVGFLADSIDGSASYDATLLDDSLTSEEIIKPEYLIGLYQGITAIINVEAILSDLRGQLKQEKF